MCLVWRRERGGNYIRKPRLAPDGFDVSTPPVVRLGLRDVVQIVEISNLFFESLEWREGVCTDPVGEVENGPNNYLGHIYAAGQRGVVGGGRKIISHMLFFTSPLPLLKGTAFLSSNGVEGAHREVYVSEWHDRRADGLLHRHGRTSEKVSLDFLWWEVRVTSPRGIIQGTRWCLCCVSGRKVEWWWQILQHGTEQNRMNVGGVLTGFIITKMVAFA